MFRTEAIRPVTLNVDLSDDLLQTRARGQAIREEDHLVLTLYPPTTLTQTPVASNTVGRLQQDGFQRQAKTRGGGGDGCDAGSNSRICRHPSSAATRLFVRSARATSLYGLGFSGNPPKSQIGRFFFQFLSPYDLSFAAFRPMIDLRKRCAGG